MEYYIEPAEQTPEVQTQLKAITAESLNPEELTLLDPACGSGTFWWKPTTSSRRYTKSEAIGPGTLSPSCKEPFWFEIIDRAAQLAAFALMMKARADDRRIFVSGIQPHVLAIQESKGLNAQQITEALNVPILKTALLPSEYLFEELEEERSPLFSRKNLSVKGDIAQTDMAQLIELFEHGKTFGSLICVPEEWAKKLPSIVKRMQDVLTNGDIFAKGAATSLLPLVQQAHLLSKKYHVVVANPPYMGNKAINGTLKRFAQENFPQSKTDLFSMFMERLLAQATPAGYMGLMTPFVWMFLQSYESIRTRILNRHYLVSLIQPQYHAFFDSAFVPICAFVVANSSIRAKGTFIRLTDFYGEDCTARKSP